MKMEYAAVFENYTSGKLPAAQLDELYSFQYSKEHKYYFAAMSSPINRSIIC